MYICTSVVIATLTRWFMLATATSHWVFSQDYPNILVTTSYFCISFHATHRWPLSSTPSRVSPPSAAQAPTATSATTPTPSSRTPLPPPPRAQLATTQESSLSNAFQWRSTLTCDFAVPHIQRIVHVSIASQCEINERIFTWLKKGRGCSILLLVTSSAF